METRGQPEPVPHQNYVGFYRHIVRLRRLISKAYKEGHDFPDGQVLALLVAIYSAGERTNKSLARLLGQQDSSLSEAFLAQLRDVSNTGKEDTSIDLWNSLSHLQFKGLRGPRYQGRTRALFLDSIVLFGCPNGYLHLLRDDLMLRLDKDYGTKQVGLKRDQWKSFWKMVKASETSSRRLWMATHDRPPESPPEEWWEKVARQKGLLIRTPDRFRITLKEAN